MLLILLAKDLTSPRDGITHRIDHNVYLIGRDAERRREGDRLDNRTRP